ncbi:MAG: DUF2179 domain-containing protein [Candidatus Atribacteria bacterium]|nr:MAG: DUF2179 domain-containing protein [Candidatus Atribacteria bacterium]
MYLVYAIIRRSDFNHVNEIIKGFDPKAVYSIEDVRFVSEGIFPVKRPGFINNILAIPRWRKGKGLCRNQF